MQIGTEFKYLGERFFYLGTIQNGDYGDVHRVASLHSSRGYSDGEWTKIEPVVTTLSVRKNVRGRINA